MGLFLLLFLVELLSVECTLPQFWERYSSSFDGPKGAITVVNTGKRCFFVVEIATGAEYYYYQGLSE